MCQNRLSARYLFVQILVLVFAAALTHPNPVLAKGFQPVSADEFKMTEEPLAPGAPAIILYREVNRDGTHNKARRQVAELPRIGSRYFSQLLKCQKWAYSRCHISPGDLQ